MKNAKLKKSVHCSLFTVHCRNGFTLVEVIVAIAILAITLVVVMQLFSGGLRASRASCDYTRALVHAKDKMEEISMDILASWRSYGLEGGVSETTQGTFEDGYSWEVIVEPYEKSEQSTANSKESIGDRKLFKLLKIKVRILWHKNPQQQNSVELISLRTVSEEE